jgi:hypothetical protein
MSTEPAQPSFAFSRSKLSYRVVHRVLAGTPNGHLLSFCRGKPIIDPKGVETIAELRGARLCLNCFRENNRG